MNTPLAVREPSLWLRLLIWFGVYFGAQLPLIAYASTFWLYPLGLLVFFAQVFSVQHPGAAASHLLVALVYGFYLIHFAASVLVKEKRVLWLLLVVLIVALGLNTTGCSEAWEGVKQRG